jgi:hypothetical protein
MFHRCRFQAMFSAVVFHQVTGHTVTTVNGQRCTGNVLRMLPLYRMLRIDSMMEHAACSLYIEKNISMLYIAYHFHLESLTRVKLPSPFLGHE